MWDFEKSGSRTALIEDTGREMTYAELVEEKEAIGRIIPERSLVFVFCRNRIECVAGYVSFIKNRIVPALVKYDLEKGLRDELIGIYRPDYVYAPEDMAEQFPGMRPVREGADYVLFDASGDGGTDRTGAGRLKDRSHALYPELGLLLSTSGSTGSPRFVRQSYTNIESNTASIAEYLKLDETERAITTLPMNYTYGLSIINTHLEAGAVVCLTELSMLRGEFWEFFDQVQATSFGGVPYTYEILDKMRFTRRELPSLRCMTQAGGKLSPELHRKFAEYAQEKGKKFVVMYGQTEATARMAYLPAELALKKYGSTGIAIPGGTLWLRDVDGKKIDQPHVTGELIYEGPNVTLGYAENRDDLALGDERGGRLETGDMAYCDEDGCFYIAGRLKRFLKLFGNRVNLDEMERLLRTAYPDADLACGGRDDLLTVYVVSEDKKLKKEMKHFLEEKTALSPVGFKVVSVEKIPRNEAGKIQYHLLGQQ